MDNIIISLNEHFDLHNNIVCSYILIRDYIHFFNSYKKDYLLIFRSTRNLKYRYHYDNISYNDLSGLLKELLIIDNIFINEKMDMRRKVNTENYTVEDDLLYIDNNDITRILYYYIKKIYAILLKINLQIYFGKNIEL